MFQGRLGPPLLWEVYDNGRQGLITLGNWWRRRIQCEHCGAHLSAASFPRHIENQHGVFQSKVLNRTLQVDQPPLTYCTTLSLPMCRLHCPFQGCTGTLAVEANLCRNFAARCPNDLVSTLHDKCPPKYNCCGIQVTLVQQMGGHIDTQ